MPGKQNVIADTLSRPPYDEEDLECCHVAIDFPKKGAKDFRLAQKSDPEINKIIESFEKYDENVLKLTAKGYMMIDGVLYRYCEEEDSEAGQVVIPKSKIQNHNVIMIQQLDIWALKKPLAE